MARVTGRLGTESAFKLGDALGLNFLYLSRNFCISGIQALSTSCIETLFSVYSTNDDVSPI